MGENVAKAIAELKSALDSNEHGSYGVMQLVRALNEASDGLHHTVPAAAFPALAKLVVAVHQDGKGE